MYWTSNRFINVYIDEPAPDNYAVRCEFIENISGEIDTNLKKFICSEDLYTRNFGMDILKNKCKYLKELKKSLKLINKLEKKEK